MTSLLVLGGTRSGKSTVAEAAAARLGGPVTYVATAAVDPDDADHRARVEAHRARRPGDWVTVECDDPADVAEVIADAEGVVLVDSLGTWVARFPSCRPDPDQVTGLAAACRDRRGSLVVVSEEVGSSLHAPSALGRAFVDAVGACNQAVAAVVDQTWLVTAGRVLVTERAGAALDRLDPGAP